MYDADPLVRVSIVKQGLSPIFLDKLAKRMALPKDKLLKGLGISQATVSRKARAATHLSPEDSERALGMARLIGKVEAMVQQSGNPEGFDAATWAADWIEQPLPALNGMRPANIMDTAEGQAIVSNLVATHAEWSLRLSLVSLWRIGADTPDYTAEKLSGKGAEMTGGRWNRKGSSVVYASTSIALACLETVVHLRANALPLNRYLVEIIVPQALWNARVEFDVAALVGGEAVPEGKISLDAGETWLVGAQSLLLLAPSVVVPEERNILISPRHPDAPALSARKVRRWAYDPRLKS